MRKTLSFCASILLYSLLCCSLAIAAPLKKQSSFRFIFAAHLSNNNFAHLSHYVHASGKTPPAFIVVNGLKTAQENCTDPLYQERLRTLGLLKTPVFISLAGSDWTGCRNDAGTTIAYERLQRLRDLLSQDNTRSPHQWTFVRQSASKQFEVFSENTYWIVDGILFASIHLPANNNHYSSAAGRNNEFEDRLTANRNWIQRLLTIARRQKIKGIVLFSDANPFQATAQKSTRDGFLETRKHLAQLISRFNGKVLFVHGNGTQKKIQWKDNLGIIGVQQNLLDISVTPSTTYLFSIRDNETSPRRKKR